MSRPRNTSRSVDVHVLLPEDLVADISLILFSDLEGRVPYGAFQKFYTQALREYLHKLKEDTNED